MLIKQMFKKKGGKLIPPSKTKLLRPEINRLIL